MWCQFFGMASKSRSERESANGDGFSRREREIMDALYSLGRQIRNAKTEAELSEIEVRIDDVLRAQRARTDDDEHALDAATLNVAAHRLENLIHDRRIFLGAPH